MYKKEGGKMKTELKVYAMNTGLVIFEIDNKKAYDIVKNWLDDAYIDYKEEGKHSKRLKIPPILTLDVLINLSETFKIIVE